MRDIDLRSFKGVFYDLDEIGLVLGLDGQPGAETLGRALKAAGRLEEWLKVIPEPGIIVFSHVGWIRRALLRLRQPESLFSKPDYAGMLARPRESHRALRAYIETLETAWSICALDRKQADKAAGW